LRFKQLFNDESIINRLVMMPLMVPIGFFRPHYFKINKMTTAILAEK